MPIFLVRVRQQADAWGADAVICFDIRHSELKSMLMSSAIGTAVKLSDV